MFLITWCRILWDFIYFIVFSICVTIQRIYRFVIPLPLKSLEDEVILLTGSAGGIGREICKKLVNSGATLICWDINKRENESMVRELRLMGMKAFGFTVDVSDRISVEGTAARNRREIGPITILINNSGILPCHTLLSHNPREITRCFEVNVLSQLWILREFLPDLIEHKRGQIVNVISSVALIPSKNLVPYSSATHALEGLINSLKYELRFYPEKPDIKFTTVYTGFCNTNLLRSLSGVTRFESILPIVKPSEVAEKLIDGLRRNYEKVYVPSGLSIGSCLRNLPPKLQFLATDLINYYIEPENDCQSS